MLVTRYVWLSCEGTTAVTGSMALERFKLGEDNRRGGRTADEISAELAHPQVVRPYVAVYRARADVRVPDAQRLHGISGVLEGLNRLAVLRSRTHGE